MAFCNMQIVSDLYILFKIWKASFLLFKDTTIKIYITVNYMYMAQIVFKMHFIKIFQVIL